MELALLGAGLFLAFIVLPLTERTVNAKVVDPAIAAGNTSGAFGGCAIVALVCAFTIVVFMLAAGESIQPGTFVRFLQSLVN